MIEIFRTNVKHKTAKNKVLSAIKVALPGIIATLELDDNDKVLRVAGAWAPIEISRIIEVVNTQGFECELIN